MELKPYLMLLTILSTVAVTFNCHSQTVDAKDRINEVKRDTAFLYAEATMTNPDSASLGAKAILEVLVREWANREFPDSQIELCLAKAQEHTNEIVALRGRNMYRAFVYVDKRKIMLSSSKSENIPSQNLVKKDTLQQSVEAVSIENEHTSFPLMTKTDVVEPEFNKTVDIPKPSSSQSVRETPLLKLTYLEEQMVAIRQFEDIQPFITNLYNERRVDSNGYGKYSTLPVTGDCYLFVYNRQGNVVATLKRTDGNYINLNTLQSDALSRFSECGAIWLQLK